jgi:uncharacterized membrane protein
MKGFKHFFLSGLLVLAPLFLTLVVIGYLFKLADAFVVNPVFRVLPFHIDASIEIFLTKILIAVCVVAFVVGIGAAAEKIFARQLMAIGEALLKRIPLFSKVYGSIKEIAQAFFGDKKGIFKRVVFIEYPRKGIYTIGFVTQDKPWEVNTLTGKDMQTVFVPSPPNPATGFFVFVPKEEIIETSISIEEAVRLVLSGGAALPGQRILPVKPEIS